MDFFEIKFDDSFVAGNRPKGVTKEQDRKVRELFKEIDDRRAKEGLPNFPLKG